MYVCTDRRITCAKTIIPIRRDFRLAEWIKRISFSWAKERRNHLFAKLMTHQAPCIVVACFVLALELVFVFRMVERTILRTDGHQYTEKIMTTYSTGHLWVTDKESKVEMVIKIERKTM